MRGLAAIVAMAVALATFWLILSPVAQGESPSPLRAVVSVVLIFGIAFLGAILAIVLHDRNGGGRGHSA